MKSIHVTQNLFSPIRLRLTGTTFMLLALLLASCQKEQMPLEATETAQYFTSATSRSSVADQEVVQHIQWTIAHFVPLVSDPEASSAIESGNTSSAVVVAKLASLGYSSFEQFAEAYYENGASIFSAVQSGGLTGAGIQQVVSGHSFNLTVLGDDPPSSAAMPCTDQFASDMAMMPVVVAAATSATSPVGGAVAGALHTAMAYRNYKNCMRANYPDAYPIP